MSDTLLVQGNRPDNRVILWEKDTEHPGGEVFISHGKVLEVAPTPAVLDALRRGFLIELTGKQAREARAALEDSSGAVVQEVTAPPPQELSDDDLPPAPDSGVTTSAGTTSGRTKSK